MGQIALRPREKWMPVAKARYVQVPTIDLDLKYDDAAVKDLPETQRKIFYERLNRLFRDAYKAKKEEKGKEIQRLIIKIEDRVPRLAEESEARAQALIAQENAVLKAEMAKWEVELRAMCIACVTKAREESFLAMKLKVVKTTVVAIVHVVVVLAMALIAAAVVVHGGPVTAGALLTAVKFLFGAVKTMGPKWVTTKGAIAKVDGDIKKLDALVKKTLAARKISAGPVEKADVFWAKLTTPISEVEKDLRELDKYASALMHDLSQQEAQVKKLEELAAANPQVKAKLLECQKAIERARDRLKEMEKVKTDWATVKKELAQAKAPNFGALTTVLSRVMSAWPEISLLFDSVKKIVDGL